MERLVEGAWRGVEPGRQLLRRDFLDGQGEQNVTLVAGELVRDQVAERARELACFAALLWVFVGATIERRPVVDVGWCLTGVAQPPADLAWYLECNEPPRPGGEQRLATELIQLREDRDERVVGGLQREILEIAPGGVRQPGRAAPDLVTCLSQQQSVQPADRGLMHSTFIM